MLRRHVAEGRLLVAALAVAAVAIVPGNAIAASPAAAKAPVTSNLNLVTVTGISATTAVGFGTVDSAKNKCVANRRVKLIIKSASGSNLFDTARSSANGAWMVKGPVSAFSGGTSYVVKLLPRKVGKLTCGGDKVVSSS